MTLCGDDALQAGGNGSTLSGLLAQAPNSLEAVRLWAAALLNQTPSLPKFDLANFPTSFLGSLEDLLSTGNEQLVLHAASQSGHWPCYNHSSRQVVVQLGLTGWLCICRG